jgi:hypothetical protein
MVSRIPISVDLPCWVCLGWLLGVLVTLSGCGELTTKAGDAMASYVAANQGDIRDMGAAQAAVRNVAGTVVNELINIGSPKPPEESEYVAVQDEYDSKSGGGTWDIPGGDNLGNRASPEPLSIPMVPPPPPGQATR